jgi:hypothetical protein
MALWITGEYPERGKFLTWDNLLEARGRSARLNRKSEEFLSLPLLTLRAERKMITSALISPLG